MINNLNGKFMVMTATLPRIYKEKLETEIPVQYNEYESTINANLFETQYNIEKAVKQATNIGKGGNIFENNYNILFALIGKKDIKVEMQSKTSNRI